MSVNRWGEMETLLTAREAQQMEQHSVQAFEMEYLDQLRVIPERKVLVMGEKVKDAIRNTIRKEAPAPLNSNEDTRDWINQPEPPLRPEDIEWNEERIRRQRRIMARQYVAQREWMHQEARRERNWSSDDQQGEAERPQQPTQARGRGRGLLGNP